MSRKLLLGAALLVSLPAFAQDQASNEGPATANSYSYLELSARVSVPDEAIYLGSDEYDYLPGIGGIASVQFLPYAFGFVEAEGYGRSESATEMTGGFLGAGVGVAYPVLDTVDVLATAAYGTQTVELCAVRCLDIDTDGYTLGGGVRLAASESFDVLAKYEHSFTETDALGMSTEDDDGRVKLELRAGQDKHGAVIGAVAEDESITFKLGYRYTFR